VACLRGPFFVSADMLGAFTVIRSILLTALLVLATACSRDAPVPTTEENEQMDAAANLLDQADDDLESIDDDGLNTAQANERP
jgi:hypothetical protein